MLTYDHKAPGDKRLTACKEGGAMNALKLVGDIRGRKEAKGASVSCYA